MNREAGVPIPVSGLGWVAGLLVGLLMLSIVPAKYKWWVVVWLALSGLAWFARYKRRGPLESFATIQRATRYTKL